MRTFKKLDKQLKSLPIVKTEEQKRLEEEERIKNDKIAYDKEKEAESKRRYLMHRRTQSIILGMEDKIHSFFQLPGTDSNKTSRNNSKQNSKSRKDEDKDKMKKTGFSTKTLINVELKIDDVEDSDDEIDSSLLSKDKSKNRNGSKGGKSSKN